MSSKSRNARMHGVLVYWIYWIQISVVVACDVFRVNTEEWRRRFSSGRLNVDEV